MDPGVGPGVGVACPGVAAVAAPVQRRLFGAGKIAGWRSRLDLAV